MRSAHPRRCRPCGDFCWVWEGTREALVAVLDRAHAEIEAEGERDGGRDGGNARGQSIYVRDPDGNLLEFVRYSQGLHSLQRTRHVVEGSFEEPSG